MTWDRSPGALAAARPTRPRPLGAPVRPTGTRITGPDGEGVVHLQVDYAGVDLPGGIHVWCAYGPPHQLLPDEFILCGDPLPDRTSLAIALYRDPDGHVRFAPRGGRPGDRVQGP